MKLRMAPWCPAHDYLLPGTLFTCSLVEATPLLVGISHITLGKDKSQVNPVSPSPSTLQGLRLVSLVRGPREAQGLKAQLFTNGK